ncbi:MAG: hypothetical protein ACHBN1_30955 [Heteroscytonema crispum UTEX LB 1556]
MANVLFTAICPNLVIVNLLAIAIFDPARFKNSDRSRGSSACDFAWY